MIDDESHRSVGANLTQKLDEAAVLARRHFFTAALLIFAPEVNLTSGGELILQAEVGQLPFVPTAQAVRSIQGKLLAIVPGVFKPEGAAGFADEHAEAA